MIRYMKLTVAMVATGLLLAGCSSSSKHAKLDPFAGKGSPYYTGKGPIPFGGGRYQVGEPYQVAGRWFTPREQPNYDKQGTASWYGEAFHKRMTSNGEWFNMNALTAAHATLPLPSYVKVTNLENGREVVVRVNDRGPFVGTRVIDLSRKSAEVLGYKDKGTASVRVQYIGPAPLADNGSHLLAMNRELERGTPMRSMIAMADRHKGRAAPADSVMVAEAKPAKPAVPAAAPKFETVAYAPAPPAPQPAQVPAAQYSGGEATYYIQLGSFADPDNAARARDQFASAWPVQFIELMGATGPVYRVRLGPIADAADASTALDNAHAAGFGDARLVRAQAVQASLQ
jgi:rare lipoprotein A